MEDGVFLDIMDHNDMLFLTYVQNFSSLVCLEVCQEPLSLKSKLGGHGGFLTGDLEDGIIFDSIDHIDRTRLSYPEDLI